MHTRDGCGDRHFLIKVRPPEVGKVVDSILLCSGGAMVTPYGPPIVISSITILVLIFFSTFDHRRTGNFRIAVFVEIVKNDKFDKSVRKNMHRRVADP